MVCRSVRGCLMHPYLHAGRWSVLPHFLVWPPIQSGRCQFLLAAPYHVVFLLLTSRCGPLQMRFLDAHGYLGAIVPFGALILVKSNFGDRKSTRLNSSHVAISYAVFCLKKKRNTNISICRR